MDPSKPPKPFLYKHNEFNDYLDILKLPSFTLYWSWCFILPQVFFLHVAQGFMCMWEMRRDMLCCFSQWSCHVTTLACPSRPLWCSGSTSHTVVTAPGIHSATLTVWVEALEEVGWQVEPQEVVVGMRQQWWQATSTALTAAGRSELSPPSLVPRSHCQNTTRTETSLSSTVRLL